MMARMKPDTPGARARHAARIRAQSAALALLLLLPGCGRPGESAPETRSPPAAGRDMSAEARAMAAAMSLEELAGQVLMVGATGSGSLPDWNRSFLSKVRPGGVVLFGFNIPEDPLDLVPYIEELSAASGGLRPFVAVDHEGGPVFRFRHGMTRLPAARDLGRGGVGLASAAGGVAGSELRALGISMNLAPVVEALDERNDAFLGLRAWSASPEESGRLARAFLEACQGAGTAGTLKHFPGNASVDPHHGRAVLDASMEELEAGHLLSFRLSLQGKPAAVMLSHVTVPAIDPDRPATLSPAAVDLLKRGLGFGGIVLTDDLLMQGLGGEPAAPANAVAALAAGADMLMVSGGAAIMKIRDAIVAAVGDGSLGRDRLEDAAARIIAQKLRFGLPGEGPEERAVRAEGFRELVRRNGVAFSAALEAGRTEAGRSMGQ